MSSEPELLTERDVEFLFDRFVPEWMLARLDTRLGTEDVVKIIKHSQGAGGVTGCPDGPYSDGKNAEYWSFNYESLGARGVKASVVHTVRGGKSTVLREGRITWNRLANIATLRAIEHQRETSVRGQVAASKVMRQLAFGEEEDPE
jgi:hypothetical protein